LFTASGARGILKTQLSKGHVLGGGGSPSAFDLALTIDLNTGKVEGSWTPPGGQPQNPSITLEYFKTVRSPEGDYLIFYADQSSDDAGYTLTFLLL
jgi:hypothetical protein